MKMEDQVASKDLSRELFELNIKQDSLWFWSKNRLGRYKLVRNNSIDVSTAKMKYSAYTVAELGELLPDNSKSYRDPKSDYLWQSTLFKEELPGWASAGATEANARAKLAIYLIKEGIIKPK